MKNRWEWKIRVFVVFLTGVFFLWCGIAQAQQPRLELKTTVEKEIKVKKKGQWITERIAVDKTGPSDVLVYTIVYLNTGKNAAVDARIVNPIPQGTILIPESIAGADANVTCSIDNAKSWSRPPVMIQAKQPNGVLENKPAPANRYTHIQWVIKKPVESGQSGRVSFKATVK